MKRILLSLMAIFAFTSLAVVPASPVLAQNKDDVCEGVGAATGGTGCTPTGSVTDINTVIRNALRIFQVIVGVIAFVMMTVGGLKFITSGGDPAKVNSARSTLLYVVIGLVVVALSEIIIQFALNQAD